MGMGLCVSQVCLKAHGPLDMCNIPSGQVVSTAARARAVRIWHDNTCEDQWTSMQARAVICSIPALVNSGCVCLPSRGKSWLAWDARASAHPCKIGIMLNWELIRANPRKGFSQ